MKFFTNNPLNKYQLVPNFVTYFTGNNRPATVLQVNKVIQAMNSLVGSYRSYDLQFTGSGIIPALPVLTQRTMSAGECSHGCVPPGNSDCATYCGCAPACSNENSAALSMKIVPVGVGAYQLTINMTKGVDWDYTKLKGIGIYPSVLPLVTERIGINQTSLTPTEAIYDIVTTAGGVPTNGIIDKLIFQFRFYGAIFEPIAG